jgi:hypothetical protein
MRIAKKAMIKQDLREGWLQKWAQALDFMDRRIAKRHSLYQGGVQGFPNINPLQAMGS